MTSRRCPQLRRGTHAVAEMGVGDGAVGHLRVRLGDQRQHVEREPYSLDENGVRSRQTDFVDLFRLPHPVVLQRGGDDLGSASDVGRQLEPARPGYVGRPVYQAVADILGGFRADGHGRQVCLVPCADEAVGLRHEVVLAAEHGHVFVENALTGEGLIEQSVDDVASELAGAECGGHAVDALERVVEVQ